MPMPGKQQSQTGSQTRAPRVTAPGRHPVMPGDVAGCHNWGRNGTPRLETRVAHGRTCTLCEGPRHVVRSLAPWLGTQLPHWDVNAVCRLQRG